MYKACQRDSSHKTMLTALSIKFFYILSMFLKNVLLVIIEKTAVTRVPIHLSEECVLRPVPAIEHFVIL